MTTGTGWLKAARRAAWLGLALAGGWSAPAPAGAQAPPVPPALTRTEQRIRAAVTAAREDQVGYLQRVVDIPSSTLDLAGVRRVGDVFRASFDSLGFTTTWVEMPAGMRRAGHLVAERRGRPGSLRMLLIGHFDTVVDAGGPSFARRDSMAAGIGSGDMKGGDVIILYALRALYAAGALADLDITVVMTGDEEAMGSPVSISRAALLDAAHRTDVGPRLRGRQPR